MARLRLTLRIAAALVAAFLIAPAAFAQAVIQSGPILNGGGHAPVYMPAGPQGAAQVMDSGPAAGGPIGTGLSEKLLQAKGPGTGPDGTHDCDYGAYNVGNPSPPNYLCFDPNALGGGLILFNSPTGQPFQIIANGVPWPPNSTLAIPGVIDPTQKPYSCAGNGTTDDTACLNAAAQAAGQTGYVLSLGPHHYLISSSIVGPGVPYVLNIQGNSGPLDLYITSCPAGISSIIVNSDITAFQLNDQTDILTNTCIQMATSPGLRGAGAAIAVGGTATTQNGGTLIQNDTILNPYNGIINGGATTGTTQTNSTTLRDDVMKNPSSIALGEGLTSINRSTVGTTISNVKIACFAANSNTTGFKVGDSALSVDFTDNGPYGCNIGTELSPGSGQSIIPKLTGVLGDSNLTYSLLVTNTSASSDGIADIQADGIWTAGAPALISNPNGVNTWRDFTFNDWAAQAPTSPVITIAGGAIVSITGGSQICSEGNATGPIVLVQSSATSPAVGAGQVNIAGNSIANCNGSFTEGIEFVGNGSGSGIWNLADNIITPTTPIAYTPAGETFTCHDNLGIDNTIPTITDAAQITVPPCTNGFRITGTGTPITDIINSGYSGRNQPFTALFSAATTFTTTGSTGTKFCGFSGPYNYPAGSSSIMSYDVGDGCWAHNP
jgi:hypothetical protein